MKENYGNLEELKILGESKNNTYTIEQMLDENLKTSDGENRKEVTARMERILEYVLKENAGERIVLVSHGAAIKFLFMKWGKLNKENKLEYDNKEIVLNSPGVVKLEFKDTSLINIKQIL